MPEPIYSRILLKISGEALIGKSDYGIDPKVMDNIASQIKEVIDMGVEIAVVIGGGNFWRQDNCRLYWHAGNNYECFRSSRFIRKKGSSNTGSIFNYYAGNSRTIYKKKGTEAFRKKEGGNICRWNR
jgi:hypothetical protein